MNQPTKQKALVEWYIVTYTTTAKNERNRRQIQAPKRQKRDQVSPNLQLKVRVKAKVRELG